MSRNPAVTMNYNTIACREARVWQDKGIVFYNSESSSVPVAQFIGAAPLSPWCNKFSIEIVSEGESCCIAIGLCDKNYNPDQQPGWEKGSVGYHADDGGIFLGTGTSVCRKSRCGRGDVMMCEIDFSLNRVQFYKNHDLVFRTDKLSIPSGGLHPAIGLHSVGEAVRLLEREPWQSHENVFNPDPVSATPRVVYHSAICRETRVWHGAGVLSYNSSSPAIPVTQFMAARPLSVHCNCFSIQIINEGHSCYIAIGLAPKDYSADRQPGWNPGSVGYHADDGGIYLGMGTPSVQKSKSRKGDIMTCELDYRQSRVHFYKNYRLVYTTNILSVPASGFHPIVGMHSVGEAVRLLEKEPWLPA